MTEQTLDQVTIYTDGSSRGNPGNGGYGAVLVCGKFRKELSKGFKHTTNNRMELLGVIDGLKALKHRCKVKVVSDSKYVVEAISKNWLENWKRKGWKTASKKPVKNQDLWLILDQLLTEHEVTFQWVKGHAGHPENERCDELAVEAAMAKDLPNDEGFVDDNE